MSEIWKPVPGHENRYEASSFGRVRSLVCRSGRRKKPLVLRPSVSKLGYLNLTIVRNGSKANSTVHIFVATAFLGPCPVGMEVNHKDGDKSNSCPDNLEYLTRGENIKHAYQTGLRKPLRSEDVHKAVLTWEKVRKIRSLFDTGEFSQSELATQFGVERTTIGQVVRHTTWRERSQG